MAGHARVLAIISVYNEYEKLQKVVQSLQEQALKPIKTIIIDDGSPDVKVGEEIMRLATIFPQLNIQPLRMEYKSEPDLDTVGLGFKKAWFSEEFSDFDFVCLLDADMRLKRDYLLEITKIMEENPKLACASGGLVVKEEYVEKINIGAKVGRKDARGAGKIISARFLSGIELKNFPDIAWDTWINTKAKINGYKAKEIDGIYAYVDRPTTRVAKKDLYRSGRLTYHFGYNPALVLLKTVLAGRGAIQFLKGYWNARKAKWQLEDKSVRKYFGWRFLFHPLR